MGMGYYECPDCGKVLEKSRKQVNEMDFEGVIKMSPKAKAKYRKALKKWQQDLEDKIKYLEKTGVLDIEEQM